MPRSSRCASCPARQQKTREISAQFSLFNAGPFYDVGATRQMQKLREAIAPYLCLDDLRRLAANGESLQAALRSANPVPDEVQALVSLLAILLTPSPSEAITTPADLAALMIAKIGSLDHEEFWVVCLDTRLRLQCIAPLYRGTANASVLRVSEVFRPAIALNSTAIMVAHNHPGGSTSPSTEDIQVTVSLREAGRYLDIELIDHLIIAQGRWLSMREQRQGW